ncbi:MAG: peptidase dimerization domain-containing protein, partial [Woeseiaceae bacterium]
PVAAGHLPQMQAQWGTISEQPEITWAWLSFGEYLDVLEDGGLAINIASLAGHGALRIAVMGLEEREPTTTEMGQMEALLEDAMSAGAFGLSTGLVYPPGCFARTAEIVQLCRVVARFGGLYASHVRGERELTFNAGNIQGGTDVQYDVQHNRGSTFGKTNVVAQTAIVHGGIRAISPEQLERAKTKMREIVAANLPQTSATIEFDEGYPPMAPTDGNRAVLQALSEVNVDLGRGPMKELDPLKRGAADVSFVAPYTDALAGMGTLGKGGHTPEESVDLTSLPLAIKRAAILIYRLSGAQ